ncbi:hypothetical protein [Kitasatospora sp. NPDC097643]|uniref:hypothetical protein n=1 Tax=Kitasatospora sp. NPDC097643 TaxID=3157230 RepID=UPI003316F29A
MRELHSLPSPSDSRGSRRWTASRAAALAAAVTAAGVLVACSSSSTNPSVGPSGHAAGESPSASVSGGASPEASESPTAVASAAESAAAAAASFAASAAAQQVQTQQKAASVLADLPGGGNALGSVTLTQVPLTATGGLPAVWVTIQNDGTEPANYAVQVDFTDTSGKTVDSAFVGAENVPVNGQATPLAFSRNAQAERLLPVVVKAVRY